MTSRRTAAKETRPLEVLTQSRTQSSWPFRSAGGRERDSGILLINLICRLRNNRRPKGSLLLALFIAN